MKSLELLSSHQVGRLSTRADEKKKGMIFTGLKPKNIHLFLYTLNRERKLTLCKLVDRLKSV